MRETVIGAGAPSLAVGAAIERASDELYDNLHLQWELYPTTEHALRNLRTWCDSHDCQLGVVANMDDRLPDFLETLGIAKYFDFTLSSYECGAEQPEPYIYYNALHLASVPPSAFAAALTPPALHCGHLAMDDLHGALGAGFASLLVNTKFSSLSPLQQMITEWQGAANKATRAWHSPHLGLAMGLLDNSVA
jgi:FMN phosphatase YigB (HAD superfamily)